VIYQLSGRYGVGKPHLRALHAQVQAVVAVISGAVTFQWVRREYNRAADALAASHALNSSPSVRTYLADVATAPIAPALRIAIAALNANPGPGFGEFVRLRVGGTDVLSAYDLATLRTQVAAEAWATVQAAFAEAPADQAAVLRWALRGLALELAIRKGQVAAELRDRAHARN